jgi:hypothetical protein
LSDLRRVRRRRSAYFLVVAARPWTLEGPVDLDFDEHTRERNRAHLTDPHLTRRFRRKHPLRRGADYDEMVRALDFVWDCPHDGSVNVTGFCCATCGRARTEF